MTEFLLANFTVREMQIELHRWAVTLASDLSSGYNIGQDMRRARCVETRTAGSAGGMGKRTGSNPDTAPHAYPTLTQWVVPADGLGAAVTVSLDLTNTEHAINHRSDNRNLLLTVLTAPGDICASSLRAATRSP